MTSLRQPRPRYNGKYQHGKIRSMLGETRVHDTLTNVVIPTFDVRLLQPIIFSTTPRTNRQAAEKESAWRCHVYQHESPGRRQGLKAGAEGYARLPLHFAAPGTPPPPPPAMAKFNVVQKNRREWNQDRKRRAHGDPNTGKLKQYTAPVSVSGKRKRKLLRRLNREQKEAVMITALENNMDVEMASAEVSSEAAKDKSQMKFNVKKNSRIQIKILKGKGRKKAKNAKQPTKEKVDAMVE